MEIGTEKMYRRKNTVEKTESGFSCERLLGVINCSSVQFNLHGSFPPVAGLSEPAKATYVTGPEAP
jgi:hypothetical protein